MKLKLNRTRMIAEGNLYSYECIVPVSESERSKYSYFIVQDGEYCVPFCDATRPAELNSMPRGVARYDAFMAHAKACGEIEWRNLQIAFPELAGLGRESLVSLPDFDATSKTVYQEVN